MSLIPIEGVLETIAKAEAVDADSTRLLCEMALFDVMEDLCEVARPDFERDVEDFIAKRADDVRRALVRQYLERRVDGEDVEEVLKAAGEATLLEAFSKADNGRPSGMRPDDPRTKFYDARDMMGRFTSAAGAFKRPGYVDPIRNERYTAVRETGNALQQLDNKSAKAVGAMASAAGGLGPEAERVLGRGVKRVAYRYRGTERTADKNVTTQVKNARALIDAEIAARGGDEAAEQRLSTLYQGFSRTKAQTFDGERRVTPGQEPFMAISRHWGGKAGRKFSEDQARLAVQGDIAAEYLRTKLPTPSQTAISMAAGRTPPSVGLLIDADGDVVSEAQGFNGDHFLPFDLKNLKRMQGGQYVRTRAMGGPTVEDVYTGLLTGARQVQVVSNSGVFTLEFDPTIRGGRRYSDKATQMIRRYEQLLAAVGSGQLMQQDIPATSDDPNVRTKRVLREEAIQEARGNATRAREIYQELLDEERGRQTFAFQEDDELEAQAVEEARAELGGNAGRAQVADLAQDKLRDKYDKQRAARAKVFQLDADGYAAAMKSLQEEFPFYIRAVRTETLPEFVRTRGLRDPESADVPVHNPAADRGHIERGEVNINVQGVKTKDKEGKPTVFADMGRGILRQPGGGDEKPVETGTEGSGTGTTGAAGPTGAARPSQQPDKAGWRVQYEVAKDTKKLSDMVDFTRSEVQEPTAIALNDLRNYAQAEMEFNNPKIGQGQETAAVAIKSGSPVEVALWLQSKDDPARALAELPGDLKPLAIEKLEKLEDAIKSDMHVKATPAPEAARTAVMASVKPFVDLVKQAQPFGPSFDVEAARKYVTTGHKPMYFPEIDNAGDKIENYEAIKRSSSLRTKGLDKFLDHSSPTSVINTLKSELDDVEAKKPPPQGQERRWRPEVIKQELEAAYFAWAYQHGRKLAEAGGAAPFVKAASTPLWDAEELLAMFRAGPHPEAVRKALSART